MDVYIFIVDQSGVTTCYAYGCALCISLLFITVPLLYQTYCCLILYFYFYLILFIKYLFSLLYFYYKFMTLIMFLGIINIDQILIMLRSLLFSNVTQYINVF